MNDGGSAFPRKANSGEAIYNCYGMTLRDYFAAQAMQGIKASGLYTGADLDLSKRAYQIADAMLKERSK